MHVARAFCGGVVIRYIFLCFMDDVIFANQPRLVDVAAELKRSAHAALGSAINCAQLYQLQANGRMGLLRALGLDGSNGGEVCGLRLCCILIAMISTRN